MGYNFKINFFFLFVKKKNIIDIYKSIRLQYLYLLLYFYEWESSKLIANYQCLQEDVSEARNKN